MSTTLIPYLGVVIDGAEKWAKAINNSQKYNLPIPQFSGEEKKYYAQIRDSIKLQQKEYPIIYETMNILYQESDEYFGSLCIPMIKFLHAYYIYGVDTVNGALCGNTILYKYYLPFFKFDDNNGEYIEKMSVIQGKYIFLFDAATCFEVDNTLKFDTQDYG